MAFRFSLAAVLRLREINEQREERVLGQILARIVQAKTALDGLDAQLIEMARKREGALASSMAAFELHTSYDLIRALKERRHALQEELNQCEVLRARQIKVYQAVHQGREVLTTMRADKREVFLTERARQEQKNQDDTFVARLLRPRHDLPRQ